MAMPAMVEHPKRIAPDLHGLFGVVHRGLDLFFAPGAQRFD